MTPPKLTSLSTAPGRLSDAQAAVARGFAIFPLWWVKKDGKCACGKPTCGSPGKHPLKKLAPHGYKDATKEGKKVEKWWATFPEANIAIATGEISDIIVVDVDPRNGGLQDFAELEAAHGKIVATYRVQTPGTKAPEKPTKKDYNKDGTEKFGPGRHYYFTYSDRLLKFLKAAIKDLDGDGIDIIADKHHVLGPGSNHVNGQYEIVGSPIAACTSQAFLLGALPVGKPTLVPRLPPKPEEPGSDDAEEVLVRVAKHLSTLKTQRNNYLNDDACWFLGPYIREEEIARERVEAKLLAAYEICKPGHEREALATIASGLDAAIEKNLQGIGISDDDLALKFSDLYKDLFRYVERKKQWFFWTNEVWEEDCILDVFSKARTLCREEAVGQGKRVSKALKESRTYAAVEKAARNDKRQAMRAKDWDRNPWLLNTPAGTFEQQGQMKLRPHRLADYITKITPATPGGPCTRWLQFLDEITKGDAELIAYLRRVAGYCSTGSIREQQLFYLYGSGGNGKGTFLRALLAALGSGYAKTAQPETFLESHFEHHTAEVASLQGARLIIVPDMPKGRNWNMERIKKVYRRRFDSSAFHAAKLLQFYARVQAVHGWQRQALSTLCQRCYPSPVCADSVSG